MLQEEVLGIMLHFKHSYPYSHDAVNLSSLDISLVVLSHPSVDSPTDIHFSQEKRVGRSPGLTGFSMGGYLLASASIAIKMYAGDEKRYDINQVIKSH